MKTWLELDSGFHRNDGYVKVSGGGNLDPQAPTDFQEPLHGPPLQLRFVN